MTKQLHPLFQCIGIVAVVSMLVGCGGLSAAELEMVEYTPISRDQWPLSTPEEQGLDPDLIAELYYNASQIETVYSLLVFKNGYLVAEDYFNIGAPDLQVNIHSVSKYKENSVRTGRIGQER